MNLSRIEELVAGSIEDRKGFEALGLPNNPGVVKLNHDQAIGVYAGLLSKALTTDMGVEPTKVSFGPAVLDFIKHLANLDLAHTDAVQQCSILLGTVTSLNNEKAKILKDSGRAAEIVADGVLPWVEGIIHELLYPLVHHAENPYSREDMAKIADGFGQASVAVRDLLAQARAVGVPATPATPVASYPPTKL